MGYGGAGHWDRAAKDGAQGLQLLGIQGGTSADEVHCICSGKAGEQGSAEPLHRYHIVGCQLTDGFQVALALARVLWKGHWDWAARLLPRCSWGWGGVRLGACAAATATRRCSLRGSASLALLWLGRIGGEDRQVESLLCFFVL